MNRQRLLAAGSGAVLFFVMVGGVWIGAVRLIPPGLPSSIFMVALAFLFLTSYVWLLIGRVHRILAGTGNLLAHVVVAAAEVAAMLISFAVVYQKLGIIDNTRPGDALAHEFWTCLYFSVVTFTTLGYGDFYPQGVGRALAGMQALTGYLVLGVLASTTARVISPDR